MNIPSSESLYEQVKLSDNTKIPQSLKDLIYLSMLTSRIDEIYIHTERLTGLLKIINMIENRESVEELNVAIENLIKTISIQVADITEKYESLEEEAAVLTIKLSNLN
jgi:hypothetical protein